MKKFILGVRIDDISLPEALERVEEFLKDGKKHYIVTPNPEIIVAAQKDSEYIKLLNNADLCIPDGVGLKFSGKIKHRVTGIDLMEGLVRLSAEKGYRIGLLGGEKVVAEKTKECLQRQYQSIPVAFAQSGGRFDKEGNFLNSRKAKIPPLEILFVGLGQGKQEKWIAKNLNSTSVKVFMVVGGAFDIISHKIPRAPLLIRKLGLEWFFRLLVEPWRWERQLRLIEYLWLLILRSIDERKIGCVKLKKPW